MKPDEILRHHRVPLAGSEHHHVSTGWVGVDCPDCSPRTGRFRLGFEVATGRCNCWFCGPRSTVRALASACRVDAGTIVRLLGDDLRQGRAAVRTSGKLKLPGGVVDMLPAHRRYVARRGFDPDKIARLWGVRGIGIAPVLSWRLFIPVRAVDGGVVSWTTRAIGDDPMRYVSAAAGDEDVSHKTILYGADLARSAAVVVEGPLDAWAFGPGAVAVLGLVVTDEQVVALHRYDRVAICFDSSPDAQRRANDLAGRLEQVPIVDVVELETGDDPAAVAASGDRRELSDVRRVVLGV